MTRRRRWTVRELIKMRDRIGSRATFLSRLPAVWPCPGWRRRQGRRGEVRAGREKIPLCSAQLHLTSCHTRSPATPPPPRRAIPMKGEQSVMNCIAVHVWTDATEQGRTRTRADERVSDDFLLTLHNAVRRDTHYENEYARRLPSTSPPPLPPPPSTCNFSNADTDGVPEDFP